MRRTTQLCGAVPLLAALACSSEDGADAAANGAGTGTPEPMAGGMGGGGAEPDDGMMAGAEPGSEMMAGVDGNPEGPPSSIPLDESDGDAPAGAAPGPGQSSLAALPSVRQEHAVVALGAEVFVIGGFTPNATSSVEAYDPASDSWRSVAAFPNVLHHANAASVDGTLIVAGFYLGGSFTDARGDSYAYDAAADAWRPLAPLPAGTERASACVATLDGKLYLFGGARNGSVADASVYDLASDSWQELPPLPEPREHCAAGAIDGRIIIAGGRSAGIGGFQPNTWSFDPESVSYEIRAPLLTARGGVAGAVLDQRLVIFGGEGNASAPSGVFSQVEAYDAAADSWQALPDMLLPRHGLGAATQGDAIYLPGGASQQGFGAEDTHTVFRFE